jgi:hypothetical protein
MSVEIVAARKATPAKRAAMSRAGPVLASMALKARAIGERLAANVAHVHVCVCKEKLNTLKNKNKLTQKK